MHAGLVQRCKGRYEFLRQGAALAGRTRRRTFEGADQPLEYEKDMRNRPAVLECLTCTLAAILNLSVLKANQVCTVCMILMDSCDLYRDDSSLQLLCVQLQLVLKIKQLRKFIRMCSVCVNMNSQPTNAKPTFWTMAVCD